MFTYCEMNSVKIFTFSILMIYFNPFLPSATRSCLGQRFIIRVPCYAIKTCGQWRQTRQILAPAGLHTSKVWLDKIVCMLHSRWRTEIFLCLSGIKPLLSDPWPVTLSSCPSWSMLGCSNEGNRLMWWMANQIVLSCLRHTDGALRVSEYNRRNEVAVH